MAGIQRPRRLAHRDIGIPVDTRSGKYQVKTPIKSEPLISRGARVKRSLHIGISAFGVW